VIVKPVIEEISQANSECLSFMEAKVSSLESEISRLADEPGSGRLTRLFKSAVKPIRRRKLERLLAQAKALKHTLSGLVEKV
jgi:hypothetical protein